jgi:hypothetical protein
MIEYGCRLVRCTTTLRVGRKAAYRIDHLRENMTKPGGHTPRAEMKRPLNGFRGGWVLKLGDVLSETPGRVQGLVLDGRVSELRGKFRDSPAALWKGGLMAEVADRRAGFHSVTPRMVVGDLESAVSFLRTVFGAVGEVRAGRPAEIRIGDSFVMITKAGERERFPRSSTCTSRTWTRPTTGRRRRRGQLGGADRDSLRRPACDGA